MISVIAVMGFFLLGGWDKSFEIVLIEGTQITMAVFEPPNMPSFQASFEAYYRIMSAF
jgi:hypothetical protein